MEEKKEFMEFDDLDLRLAVELEVDARQSNAELAAKLGTSSSTVRRRLKNLLDSRAITITSITSAAALGFQTNVLIGIHVKPGKSDAVMHHLITCPAVQYCGAYVGHHDLLVSIAFRDEKEIIGFVEREVGSTPDIVGFELMIVLESVKSSWRYLGGSRDKLADPAPRDHDQHERMLVKYIESNPRESIKVLSRKLGLSTVSVSKALRRLLKENVINVVGIINPEAFGLHSLVAILVEVLPAHVSSVADRMASHLSVHHVVVVTGQFSIFMWAVFKDSGELYRFLRDDLGCIPGVIRHETMQQIAPPRLAFKLTPYV